MSAAYRRDVLWLAAQERYADPAWDDDPDTAYARRIIAAFEMREIARQYAGALPQSTCRPA